ncbi:type II toxin-antitoxin system VapC family toxin [Brasilonema sp. UFV-L1]|uniref:type II toxin-antitoxin system VapC family toxin n=1 Tax=Brasilonema sp. UFV-L1 TaxID=2234130 RepID=UPI001B7CEF3F|nr:type II toxin-antitoxin system VapC family toxin [Brasilonema sp. UFV-L1]
MAVLNALPLQVYPSQPLMLLGIDIALQTQRTVYDSLYLALAVTQGCQMVTADKKFYNALNNSTFASSLVWVEEI